MLHCNILEKSDRLLAVDVHYQADTGTVAGIAFASWAAEYPTTLHTTRIENVSAYVPGEFYKRELPCILKLLEEHHLSPHTIVVDGYVYLDGCAKPGLGKHLYDALEGKIKVIGVAKKPFAGISSDYEVYRGDSRKPLYVTTVGETLDSAKQAITAMYGSHRIPALLKKADQLCRESS